MFLDLIFFRRKARCIKYIAENTKKFDDENKLEIEGIEQAANSRLNAIRDHLKLCKQKCSECFYPCLLRKNHEDHAEWEDNHSCRQTDHTCRLKCTYCSDNGKEIQCGLKAGHQGNHNCKQENHTCGKQCSLSQYGGCQIDCDLVCENELPFDIVPNSKIVPKVSGHAGACKCAAETHLCEKTCGVAICKNTCRVAYNKSHDEHICIQQNCPYKCEVLCWNEALKKVAPCGRPCASRYHDHALRMDSGDCKDEGHTCDEVLCTHSSSDLCL